MRTRLALFAIGLVACNLQQDLGGGPTGTTGTGASASTGTTGGDGGAGGGGSGGGAQAGTSVANSSTSAGGGHPGTAWAALYGDTANQFGRGVAVDPDNNVIVVGSAAGSIDFGDGSVDCKGFDAFIAKFDPKGVLLWKRVFGDGQGQHAASVAADAQGRIAVFGVYSGTIDVGLGPLTATKPHNYVLVLAPDGAPLRQRDLGNGVIPSVDDGTLIAMNASGEIAVTASCTGATDPGAGTLPCHSGLSSDVMVVKYDSYLNVVFQRSFGDDDSNNYAEVPYSVAITSAGSVIITGSFGGKLDYGGAEALTITGPYGSQPYILRFEPDGEVAYAMTSEKLTNSHVAVSPTGSSVIFGQHFSDVDFGNGITLSTGANDYGAHLIEIDASGQVIAATWLDTPYRFVVHDVATDYDGNVAITGTFYFSADFGGGSLGGLPTTYAFLATYDSSLTYATSHAYDVGPGASGTLLSVAFDSSGHVVATGFMQTPVDFGVGAPLTPKGIDACVVRLLP